jgi:hypothetical protein
MYLYLYKQTEEDESIVEAWERRGIMVLSLEIQISR